ncbi:MAG: glycosyltransferase [Bacteroidales bacterium]|nr:glycosyltransferase [Bacteroidales bacterium]
MGIFTTPKVSVIIPVYGVEKYIEKCAISLFEQTLQDIEYIFVNDCTKDSSIDVLLKVLERYPYRKEMVRIINHEINMGLPAARKTGIIAAKGDYIIHCDSDDWISKDLYSKMYKSIISSNADVAICDIWCSDGITNTSIIKGTTTLCYDKFLHNIVRMNTSWSLVNKMFKRSVYFENITYPTSYMGEDMALCIQLLSFCKSLSYVNDSYYYYFNNIQSISKKEDKKAIFSLYTMFAKNYLIVINHFKKVALYLEYSKDLSYNLFINRLTFAKRAKSISFLKKSKYHLPRTTLDIFKDNAIPLSLRIQSLLFYLLRI